MRKKDQALLDCIDEIISQAPEVGLCAFPFKILRDSVSDLIKERDALESPYKPEYIEEGAELSDVLGFIGRFSTSIDGHHQSEDMVVHFTCGLCFWFAYILKARFQHEYPCQIVVDYAQNHFACRINGDVYDITGRLRDGAWEFWEDCTDTALIDRITDDCIMF